MDITNIRELLKRFIKYNEELIGPIEIRLSEQIDISIFPDEIDQNKKLPGFKSGLYIFHEKVSGRVLYVGEATDVVNRIYQHMKPFGPDFSWGRNGSTCHFPNFDLTQWEGHKEYKKIFESGNFYVTAVSVEPPEVRNLLESFLIYCASRSEKDKFPLNIKF